MEKFVPQHLNINCVICASWYAKDIFFLLCCKLTTHTSKLCRSIGKIKVKVKSIFFLMNLCICQINLNFHKVKSFFRKLWIESCMPYMKNCNKSQQCVTIENASQPSTFQINTVVTALPFSWKFKMTRVCSAHGLPDLL